MSDDALLTATDGRVLTLTINRPEQRNALSLTLLDRMGETLAMHAADADLRCAVITAAGDKAFAAGGDLKELDAIRADDQALAMSRRGRTALGRIRQFPLPVVGALNGLALGGGAELAMACDLRVAVAHARIGFLQGQLNVTTAWGGGIDLIDAIGSHRALDLLLGARQVDAAQAQSLGLFHYVCAEDEPLPTGLQRFLEPITQRSTKVLRGYKALMGAGRQALHERMTEAEETNFVTAWISDDHWDAVAAAAAERARRKRS